MLALVIDFMLSFVLVFALLSAGDEVGDAPSKTSEIIAAVAFFAIVSLYFTAGNLLGRTPGMFVSGCRVMGAVRATHLRLWQAVSRAALTIALCFSFAWVATADDSQAQLNALFAVVLGISAIGRLWMLVADDRRTLFDRLLRLRVVTQQPAMHGIGHASPPRTGD
jgi:hypothetical protein